MCAQGKCSVRTSSSAACLPMSAGSGFSFQGKGQLGSPLPFGFLCGGSVSHLFGALHVRHRCDFGRGRFDVDAKSAAIISSPPTSLITKAQNELSLLQEDYQLFNTEPHARLFRKEDTNRH